LRLPGGGDPQRSCDGRPAFDFEFHGEVAVVSGEVQWLACDGAVAGACPELHRAACGVGEASCGEVGAN